MDALALAHFTDCVEEAGPLMIGRVKSFSQKSGWGFIQLYENEMEENDNNKDVFFHRADVARSGTCDLRPGILVHCRVVTTAKGEKASDIIIVEGTDEDTSLADLSSSLTFIMTCAGSSADLLSHSPYGSEFSVAVCPRMAPPLVSVSSYSLRNSGKYTSWKCVECALPNVIQSLLRVMVVCAACSQVHEVRSWTCSCLQPNAPSARHCCLCGMPYALACQELDVQPGTLAHLGESEASPAKAPAAQRRRGPMRSRWQHGGSGWKHALVEAPEASGWCQENATDATDCQARAVRHESVVEKCRPRLVWAQEWLANQGATGFGQALDAQWMRQFSEALTSPDLCLLCPVRGCPAFAPNPCVDLEDSNVLLMYEALGMVLALAVAHRVALGPVLPMWMARSLLGYPTTMHDLQEFDPQVWQRADMVQRHPNVVDLQLTFREKVKRYGITRTFEKADGSEVTEETRHSYGAWLKDVYLVKSVETQMKQIKHGFFYAFMGDHVSQDLTPADLSNVLNGTCM